MADLLQDVISRASKLSAKKREEFARLMLDELAKERWTVTLTPALQQMLDEARRAYGEKQPEELEPIFEHAANLPESEQVPYAERMLEDLDEREWQKRFDATRPMLRRMAEEARREEEAGETEDLDFNAL